MSLTLGKRKRIVYEISSDSDVNDLEESESSEEEEIKKMLESPSKKKPKVSKEKTKTKTKRPAEKKVKHDNYLHAKTLEQLHASLWTQQVDSLEKMIVMEGLANTVALKSEEVNQRNGFPMSILADDMTSGKSLCVLALATLFPTVRGIRTDYVTELIQQSSSTFIPFALSRIIVSYLSEGNTFARKTQCALMLNTHEEHKVKFFGQQARVGRNGVARDSALWMRNQLYNQCLERANQPCQVLPMGNLFVVPHGLVGQWESEAMEHLPEKFTSIKLIRKRADLWPTTTSYIDPESKMQVMRQLTKQELFASLSSTHLVICSSTRYNELAKLCFDNDIVWQRVFWDEAHSISIPAAQPIDAVRYWCITATPTVLAAYTKRTLHFLHLMFSEQTDQEIERISIRHSGMKELDVKTTENLEPFHKIIIPCEIDPLVLIYAGCWQTRSDLTALIEGATSKILKYQHKTRFPSPTDMGRHMSWFECLLSYRRTSGFEADLALKCCNTMQICIACGKEEPDRDKLVLINCCNATYHQDSKCLPLRCPVVTCRTYKLELPVASKYRFTSIPERTKLYISAGQDNLNTSRRNLAQCRLAEAEQDKKNTNSESKLNQLAQKQRRARLELVKFDSVADNFKLVDWKGFQNGDTNRYTKLQTLVKLLEQSPKLKTVIFTNELTLAQFSSLLTEAKIDLKCVEIKGQGTAIDSRLRKFQMGEIQAIWLNVHHSGAGHQLPFADQLILLDSEGSLVEDQVITRVHRFGRAKNSPLPVYCLKFK